MNVYKSVQADRDRDVSRRQPGETDIEQTPLKLRNPPLARTGGMDSGRPLRSDEAAPGGETNAANGHWLHDETGPSAYVSPDAKTFDDPRVGASDLIARIEDRLGYLEGLDASRIHLSVTGSSLVLSGQVDSVEARRRAGACAVAVAQGLPVENRLNVAG